MEMALNAAQLYRNNAIQTASPAKLILMLYDGAIKFCNIAMEGLKEKDVQKANTNIIKAERVISELRGSLDFKYEVAKDFDLVYDYIYRKLIEANIHKDLDALEEALKYTREMRETWAEVMRLTNTK